LPEEPPERLKPSFNVAPTHVMPIGRPATVASWCWRAGPLIPFWLKPEQLGKMAFSTINARAERIQTAPAFREPFKKRRCLVPASGWYEWQDIGAKKKKPFHFQPKGSAI